MKTRVSLRDSEIRESLRNQLRLLHADEPDTAIIDELSLSSGKARVDVAVVNGSLSGFEIKSDFDTLCRLGNQTLVYQLCFDTLTLVTGSSHLNACKECLPSWWGIWEATRKQGGDVVLRERRKAKRNRRISAVEVAKLLWRSELVSLFSDLGLPVKTNQTRRTLQLAICSHLSDQDLIAQVRRCLKLRGDWRSGPTPFRGGDSCQSASKSERSQMNRRWLLSELSRYRPS